MTWPAGEAALLAARREDGSWGYAPGEVPMVEPTALALLALTGRPEGAASLPVLLSWQRPDGAFPAFPGDPDPSWTTSFAALTLVAWDRREQAAAAREWLAASRVPREAPDPAARMRVREWMHIDPALEGNAWFGETSPWVEPTSMAALARLAPPVTEEDGGVGLRRDLERFLADRQMDGGGWNYGNPFAFGSHLLPLVIPTAKALLALARAGTPRPEAGLAVLERLLEESPSRISRAWAGLAFQAWGDPRGQAVVAAATAPPEPGDASDALALAVLAARREAGEVTGALPLGPPGGSDG